MLFLELILSFANVGIFKFFQQKVITKVKVEPANEESKNVKNYVMIHTGLSEIKYVVLIFYIMYIDIHVDE